MSVQDDLFTLLLEMYYSYVKSGGSPGEVEWFPQKNAHVERCGRDALAFFGYSVGQNYQLVVKL